MKVSHTTLRAVAMMLALVGAFCIGFSVNSVVRQHRDPQPRANVYILFETAQGTWSDGGGNLITNIGERYPRNIVGFNNVTNHNATKWISLSNVGSPLVTWTQLDTEINANGFSRALGAVSAWLNGSDYAFNCSYKFTSTGSQQLQCAGLNWNDSPMSDGNLFAAATFTQTTFETNDNLTITWVITWDAN